MGAQSLVVGDRKEERGRSYAAGISPHTGYVTVDALGRESLKSAVGQVDAVINTVRQTDPIIQEVCTEQGIPCSDIVPDPELADKAVSRNLDGIVSAGLIPGLSGLMAREVLAVAEAGWRV